MDPRTHTQSKTVVAHAERDKLCEAQRQCVQLSKVDDDYLAFVVNHEVAAVYIAVTEYQGLL